MILNKWLEVCQENGFGNKNQGFRKISRKMSLAVATMRRILVVLINNNLAEWVNHW